MHTSQPSLENWWQTNGFFESHPKIPERHEIICRVFINPNPRGAFTKLDDDVSDILRPRNSDRSIFGYFEERVKKRVQNRL